MERQRWFEIHDSRWFPGYLRDLVTEALEAVWNTNHTYRPIAGRLREALQRSGSDCIVDLCSGGGGPWLGLYDDIARGQPLAVRLTDLYPNARLIAARCGNGNDRIEAQSGISACSEPVDARCVPVNLRGFRTIFSSFHHFDPEAARAMLEDAFRRREGIAVFEAARRDPLTLLSVAGVGLLSLRVAVMQRPVRASRLVFTFLLPVIPVTLWIDGLLSCLRSYSLNDMRELTAGLTAPDYAWEVGEERSGTVPIRYLMGTPMRGGGGRDL
ncbi:MAG TPA: hypothetical protein VKT75_08345 [Acidobacteriaceae bacterium]|nr:hypothetical protein [Acidobacteriaceae bacterium]